MIHIFDTNVLAEVMRAEPDPAAAWLRACPAEAMFTTAISGGEILHGVRRLAEGERQRMVAEFIDARRAVAQARWAEDPAAEALARAAVDRAKRALGERGPVWWDDDAPDLNRHLACTTSYAALRDGVR